MNLKIMYFLSVLWLPPTVYMFKKPFIDPKDMAQIDCINYKACNVWAYRFVLLPRGAKNTDICPKKPQCAGALHSYCVDINQPKCKDMKFITMDQNRSDIILMNHNKLRQRIAYNAIRPAGNMNKLEWCPELARMSSGWISQCNMTSADKCDNICMYICV